jgi:GT2 family glycosyltransferase
VVVVTYNGRRYLEGCLSALQRATERDTELIVVDNGSTDGSADWVARHVPGVRLIRNHENRGFAAACNQGADLAAGDVLVFLNQDTCVKPGWLAPLVEPLYGRDEVGLTTSRVLLMSRPDRLHLCGQEVHYTGLVFGRGYLAPAAGFPASALVAAPSGASFAIRRELWQHLGGFDERFYMYYEETDLAWRARLAGCRCLYAPDSQILHDFEPQRPSAARHYYTFRNRQIVLVKNWRWRTLLLFLPGLLLAELLEWGLAAAGGWGGLQVKARADLWVLAHLAELRRMHKRAQVGRTISDAELLAERTFRLAPRTVPGGTMARAALTVCELLFRVNHWAARCVCRLWGW